jgi:serine/threonine-protein kinase
VLAWSGLLTPDRFGGSAVLDDGPPDEQARRLEERGVLTPFQARQLLQGRWKGFFLGDSYRVLDLLGGGATGWVYLVEEVGSNRLAAAKMAADRMTQRNSFWNEACVLVGILHPNLIRLLDVVVGGPAPFLLLEYVDGTDLHALATRVNRVDVGRAVNWAIQAAQGLACLHQSGLVHGDVKPGNLGLTRQGVIKLFDLGNARSIGTVTEGGTPNFIAPEQLAGEPADGRADLYGLGATLAFLLSGRLVGAPVIPEVPQGLQAVLARLLARAPNQRFGSAEEAIRALKPWSASVALPRAEELPELCPALRQRVLGGVTPRPAMPGLPLVLGVVRT